MADELMFIKLSTLKDIGDAIREKTYSNESIPVLKIAPTIREKWGGTNLPPYDGKYEVTPSVREQTLSTAQKVMTADLRIKEIPYADVSNSANGITVTIG